MCSCILGLFPVGVPSLSCLGGHWEWGQLNVDNPKLGTYVLLTSYVCFLLPGGHWLESCNDKSKLRGPLPYSGQSSEVSTPSSLYMEYGKWVLGRPGCHCVFALPLCLLSFELCGSSQLSGGCTPYSLTLPSIIFNLCARSSTALPFLLLRSDFGVPPSLMPWCYYRECLLSQMEWLSEWVRGTLKRGLWVSGLNYQKVSSIWKSSTGGSHLFPRLTLGTGCFVLWERRASMSS